MSNKELRNTIKQSGITFWKIADALGVSSDTFSRWMRHELTGERKERVLKAIETCKREAKEENKSEGE